MVHRWTLVVHAMVEGKQSKGTWQTTNKEIISNDVSFLFGLTQCVGPRSPAWQVCTFVYDLLQRVYSTWTRHGVKHGWSVCEGVVKRDDCSYLKNRELSNDDDDDDDDGSENVAKKLNLPHFKCYRVYLELLNLSNVGDFSWSWILKDFIQDQKEKEEFVVVSSLSL